MKVKDILHRDPVVHGLVNNGQARIVNEPDVRAQDELRGELSTFVCEGQYADGIQKIISSFLADLGRSSQRAAWVSGFFGSGKSHLLKMLCHLWKDTAFPDGVTARALVPAMPEELRSLLRELDTEGRRAGGLVAAAGTLPAGNTEQVRLTILSILLRGLGLPGEYAQARFCLWLHERGFYETVRAEIEASGKVFERELNSLYVSPPLARAVMNADPNFAKSEADTRQLFKVQFPPQSSDITTNDFLHTAKDALRLAGRNGQLPCTLLVLDEVQQYIGESNDRSVLVTEVTETLSKQFDSRVIVVGAGQSALTGMPHLQKLMDRFTIRVPLSDTDVETVTRKVLLAKKPSAIADVRTLLDTHGGEISRQLQGTRVAERTEDKAVIVDDYPLLPVRRRFWEHCFRQIDAAGTSSQLRSQLRIIHDAVAGLCEKQLGAVVTADELYEALAPEMVNTGVLLREINERIIELGQKEGPLARRICGLVFLIGKLPAEGPGDIGVRATQEHIADLLVADLAGDNGKLRTEVGELLDRLARKGELLVVGDEYRLQTREGSEWDQEFRNRQSKIQNNEADILFKRDQLLYAEMDRVVRGVKLVQGAAKEARTLVLHREQTPPPADSQAIPVWVRDGWSCPEKEHDNAARTAGAESPIVFVHIPRRSADDLKRLIVEADAAEQTLHAKGNPTGPEGQVARQSMDSRRQAAARARDELVREIVAVSKVMQGGGSEVLSIELHDRLRDAAEASLIRLFPRFKEADSAAWPAVIKRARDGADHPFQPTGHGDTTEKHPVCQQVLSTIGSGKTGTEVRRVLAASPFGWPRDAVDAALIALHRSQHLAATLNGAPLAGGDLDQNKIPKSEFRVEQATLSVQDRLLLRKLFPKLDIPCKSGEEAAKGSDFLARLIALGQNAGGSPPLPAPPSLTELEDMRGLAGNEQLAAIKEKAVAIEQSIVEWKKRQELAEKRKPGWDMAVRLAVHAAGMDTAKPHREQLDAIRDQRLLLESSDPVAPVLKALADLLRNTVNELHTRHQDVYDKAMQELAAHGTWAKLPEADRKTVLNDVGLRTPVALNVSTDQALANYLDAHSLDAALAEIDAISGRVSQAIQRAAKSLEPEVQTVSVDRTTLHTEVDIERWLQKQKEKILKALEKGPVLIE